MSRAVSDLARTAVLAAQSAIGDGRDVGPNTAAVLVAEIERLAPSGEPSPDGGELPTRESEAREWIEAAVMLLTKDGLDIVLTGHPEIPGAGLGLAANVAGPHRVVGDLDGLKWAAEPTFEIRKGVEVSGFEARTPEGFLVARGGLHPELFPADGTYRLQVDIDFWTFPLRDSP